MSIDRQKLKALAEAATKSHGARRVEVDHNGRHVIGDGSWKILSAWHTPDGKGAQNADFAAAASPAAVLGLIEEIERLEALLDTPHTDEWFEGVRLEAGHQIGRWGSDHDAGKEPADWFWLIGYLAQKAMTAQMAGDEKKARHHTISTGAAMLNWFRAMAGDSNTMRPGISQEGPQQ
jgi:hypothetical protein